jgi:hypothetical protein
VRQCSVAAAAVDQGTDVQLRAAAPLVSC